MDFPQVEEAPLLALRPVVFCRCSSIHPERIPDVSFPGGCFFPFAAFSVDPNVSYTAHRRAVSCTGQLQGLPIQQG